MNPESLFTACGRLALAGWLLLVLAPRWRWSARVLAKYVIPLALAGVYVGVIATHIGGSRGGFSSLAGVAELFSDRWILLAGWVHYLAFDLFIGAWEVRDAARTGVPHLLVVPCLILTFLFGPAGILAYAIVRSGWVVSRRGRATIPVEASV